MKELQAIVAALVEEPGESVLATLVSVQGSSYRRPGARLLIRGNSHHIGSISGGCLEEDLRVRMQRVFSSGRPEAVIYDTTSENDLVWGVGLGCHGVVRILIEKLPSRPAWAETLRSNFAARRTTRLVVAHGEALGEQRGTRADPTNQIAGGAEVYIENVAPPQRLILFGAGDDAQPLARLGKELGWHVTIADPRAAFATQERFPTADRIVVAPAAELAAKSEAETDALAVVMTHHYVHDVPVIRDLAPRGLRYLGLLGPKKRSEKILGDLGAEGLALTPAMRAVIHAPAGLDVGSDSPEQVALSIIAEMQSTLAARDGRPLRERTRPIHG